MKGLTPNQLLEITEFVQKYHKFGYIKEEDRYQGHLGYAIKYIDVVYDSRDGNYWSIKFRGTGSIWFTTNAFPLSEPPSDFNFISFYDWIMAFLKFEWNTGNKKEYKFMYIQSEGPLHNNFTSEGDFINEWNNFDMIDAYCGDLEDGVSTDDMLQATA